MKLEMSEPIKKAIDFWGTGAVSRMILKWIIDFLTKYFGSEILIKIPPSLQNVNWELKNWIEVAEKLQTYEIISRIKKIPKFTDEPFLHSYQIFYGGNKISGEGWDFFSEERALQMAIEEAVEKYLRLDVNQFYKSGIKKTTESLAGLASGKSCDEAAVKGILRLWEEDALAKAFAERKTLSKIDGEYLKEQDEKLKELFEKIERYELEIELFEIPNELSLPIILAILKEKAVGSRTILTAGLSADFDLNQAILNSLGEAVSARLFAKEKTEEENNGKEESRQARFSKWLTEVMSSRLNFFLDGEIIFSEMPRRFFRERRDEKYYRNKLNWLKMVLCEKQKEVYLTKLSPKKLKKIKLNSVIVLMPKINFLFFHKDI